MSKEDYIYALRDCLSNIYISNDEANSAINYYAEYLEDAFDNGGQEGVDQAIKELGTPKKLASKIIADVNVKRMDGNFSELKVKEKASSNWLLILAIFSAPIWSPIALALAIVSVVLIFVICVVIFSLMFSGACMALAGVASVIGGILVIVDSYATALYISGVGLVVLGLGILLMLGMWKLFMLLCKGTFALTKAIAKR